MLPQGQPVDDRDLSLCRELLRDLVRTGPDDDTVDEPLEIPSDVTDALAGAEYDVVRQIDRMATELDHPGFERHPRPQARLLEQKRQRPPDQRRLRVPSPLRELPLQCSGRLEHHADLRSRQISNAQQVAPMERPGPAHLLARAVELIRAAVPSAWCTEALCGPS